LPFIVITWMRTGTVALLGELEVLLELLEVVAVDGADVAQAELLEQARIDEEILGLALPLHPELVHLVAVGQAR
jgi:hypothetical protein